VSDRAMFRNSGSDPGCHETVTIDPQAWCRIETGSEIQGLTLVVTKP
jgi:hypothetical protein